MQLKKDKIGYVIMFGIAPFFNKALMNNLKDISLLLVSMNLLTKSQNANKWI